MQEHGTFSGLTRDDIDLAATLSSGQAFRWTRVEQGDSAFVGTVGRRRARLAQEPDGTVTWQADGPHAETVLRAYLRLDDADLPTLANEWCAADAPFADSWMRQPGVRVLRQDPAECFFSFLCASVAPIARISGMLRAVARNFGDPLGSVNGVPLFAFPSAAQLAQADEQALRDLGLGFRARRVREAALALSTLPPGWVHEWRDAPYADAKQALLRFFGVGEKIADCVCLFALDKNGAIPVDVHIWRIAQSWYAPDLAGKSLTPATYARAADAFRERFGPWAGWAQQTLFYRAAVGHKIERPRAPGTVTTP